MRNSPAFIAHGSPMNAIADNDFARFLRAWAAAMPRPAAIIVVSAHWRTRGTFITGGARPAQIYDFYGFPEALYKMRYSPPGDPALAREVASALPDIIVDEDRGIDHAGWVIVSRMFPGGAVPLLEISLDARKTEAEHFALGKALARFADRALIVGSGNLVHNLSEIDSDEEAAPFPWAAEADRWLAGRIEAGDSESLIGYKGAMPGWRRAAPTDEHYLPLLYVLGALDEAGERPKAIFEGIQNGSVSMRCVGAK